MPESLSLPGSISFAEYLPWSVILVGAVLSSALSVTKGSLGTPVQLVGSVLAVMAAAVLGEWAAQQIYLAVVAISIPPLLVMVGVVYGRRDAIAADFETETDTVYEPQPELAPRASGDIDEDAPLPMPLPITPVFEPLQRSA